MATTTPWGPSQTSRRIAPGVMEYTTAGHGGIKLTHHRYLQLPSKFRTPKTSGIIFGHSHWYEEDCAWAIPVIGLPRLPWPPGHVKHAPKTLKTWFPYLYEAHFGVTLAPGESYVKDHDQFKAEYINEYVSYSALRHPTNPDFVKVWARRELDGDTLWFLVNAERYANSWYPFGYVIQEGDIPCSN